jgi:hypothetical protein
VAIPAKIVPSTNIINPNKGTNETNTSFKISALGGISSAGGLGAIDGFSQALKTAYPIYKLANIYSGKIAGGEKS